MVTLSAVQQSNAVLKTGRIGRIAGVFVGATSGIGKACLLQFAQVTKSPRIYFVGRSQQAADEILQSLHQTNSEGQYTFIRADVSLLRNVDDVCNQIKAKEESLNVLFLSQGTLDVTTETSEKLPLILALSYYSRMRFIANLLPLLRRASSESSISRVISVMAGTKEGPITPSEIGRKLVAPWKARGHLCSMMTLTMEHFAENEAPDVSFVHDYPGFVKTPLPESMKGVVGGTMKAVFAVTSLFNSRNRRWVPLEESGQRHVFLATSPRYPAKDGHNTSSPVSTGEDGGGLEIAVGSNGRVGSGVYSVDEYCESADQDVQNILQELRRNGTKDEIWKHLQREFERTTGKASI